ncbi:MAG TPA: hypothetical protein VNB22_09045 [Pyrinomonadaceae bacterium]|jgi:hypothetical protein|nr:hypothetical protein [Pyrinomonadaceae bacterium]
MHCPRCGQQQVTEDIKFCSRCGFPLGLVSEVLAHGGFLPQLAELNNKSKKWLTRNFGLKISLLWFLLICFILVPLAAITRAPGGMIPGLAIIGFCGALLMAALSFLFLPKEKNYLQGQNELPNANYEPQYLSGNQNQNALPPQTSQPVSSFAPPTAGSWKAPDTGELVPHSVTEGTTKLLQKDE